jgi:membrane fusion protein, multidrug efflux system
MKNQLPILFTAIGLVLLAACGEAPSENQLADLTNKRDSLKAIYDELGTEINTIEAEMKAMNASEDLIPVTAYTAKSEMFDHYFTVQGNIETDMNATLYPETQGLVTNIYVNEGQSVVKGQKLMSLDNELVYKNIAEVQTSLDLAIEIYGRQERLWEQNIGSEVQYLEAKSRKESLQNTLATLNQQASMSVLRAPFNGIVDQVVPKIGEMASPMSPAIRIVNLKNMYVIADVSENYIGKVKEGMKVTVTVPGLDTIQTKVTRVGSYVNPENRCFEVTVELNSESPLKPNMYASVAINDLHLDSVVVLPTAMLQQDADNRYYIFAVNEANGISRVEKKLIKPGMSYRNRTAILGGLPANTQVVDKGARKVVDGQQVNFLRESAKTSTANK